MDNCTTDDILTNQESDCVTTLILSSLSKISAETKVIFILGLAVSYLAFGYSAANLSFAGDDWESPWLDSPVIFWSIEMGRWLAGILWLLQESLTLMPFLTTNICMILIVISAIRIAPIITLNNADNSLFAVLIIATVPFIMEWYTFEVHQIAMPLAFLLSVEGFRAYEKNWIISIIFFVCAVSIYQSMFSVILILFLLRFNKWFLFDKSIFYKERLKSSFKFLVIIFLSVLLYALLVKLSWVIMNVGPYGQSKYSLTAHYVTSFDILLKQVKTILGLVASFLFFENSYYPLYLKILFLIFLVICGIFIFKKAENMQKSIISMVILFFALCSVWLILLVRQDSSVRYNGLVPIGIWMAGIYCYAEAWANTKKRRLIIWSLCGVMILGFVYQHNAAFASLQLKNKRDFEIASKILERIESNKKFRSLSKLKGGVPIMMTGKMDLNNAKPFGYNNSSRFYSSLGPNIVTCGVFDCQVGRCKRLFDFIKAHRINYNTTLNDEQIANGNQLSKDMAPWPDYNSIKVTDRLVVVKIGN
jgi:hypothetical protein